MKALVEFQRLMADHPVLQHPFWERFEAGDFTLRQVRPFALQYYLHVSTTRLYAASVLARMPDESVQLALAGVLWDEYGRGDPKQTHPAQFRRFLHHLGLTPADWAHLQPIRELALYRTAHQRFCSEEDVWFGIGVVAFAMEWPIPQFYGHLVTGFHRALKLDDQALAFFLEHVKEDKVHAERLAAALAPRLSHPAVCRAIQKGITRSLDTRYLLMTGLMKLIWPE